MELSEAYQTLSDAEMRQVYDRHGADAAKQRQAQKDNGQRSGDAFDLFRQFFGGGASDETPKGPRRMYEAEMALSDVYTGRTFTLSHTRSVVCPECYGSGAESSAHIHTCSQCNGQGAQIMRQQIMPGFVTNVQVQCNACGGKGKTIAKLCKRCRGQKTVVDETEIEVEVEAGAREGAEYHFEGMGEQSPDHDAGDVVVVIHTKTGPGDFRRVGHNLYFTVPLSLSEALFGFEKELTHYDDHPFTLRRRSATQPGHVERILDEGLPIPEEERDAAQGRTVGDLFVTYSVVIPETQGKTRQALAKALGVDDVRHTEL